MNSPGDRIYAESSMYTGWGTIVEIFPGEVYSVQVELDQPDDDGHRMKRFAPYEIKSQEEPA